MSPRTSTTSITTSKSCSLSVSQSFSLVFCLPHSLSLAFFLSHSSFSLSFSTTLYLSLSLSLSRSLVFFLSLSFFLPRSLCFSISKVYITPDIDDLDKHLQARTPPFGYRILGFRLLTLSWDVTTPLSTSCRLVSPLSLPRRVRGGRLITCERGTPVGFGKVWDRPALGSEQGSIPESSQR